MRDDGLRGLYAELRRLKTVELPRAEMLEPVERAYQEERIRGAIRRVEDEIDRRMSCGRDDGCVKFCSGERRLTTVNTMADGKKEIFSIMVMKPDR